MAGTPHGQEVSELGRAGGDTPLLGWLWGVLWPGQQELFLSAGVFGVGGLMGAQGASWDRVTACQGAWVWGTASPSWGWGGMCWACPELGPSWVFWFWLEALPPQG